MTIAAARAVTIGARHASTTAGVLAPEPLVVRVTTAARPAPALRARRVVATPTTLAVSTPRETNVVRARVARDRLLGARTRVLVRPPVHARHDHVS